MCPDILRLRAGFYAVLFLVVVAMGLAARPAGAQSLSAVLPGVGAAAPAAAPAAAAAAGAPKPVTGAIIPGSPLAALTGAASPPADPDATPPTPFGTDNLGLPVLGHVAREAGVSMAEFANAIRQSTRLTPVVQWLRSFRSDPVRGGHAVSALVALLEILLPALAAEALVRFALARPRGAIVKAALVQRERDLPGGPADEGLADAEAGETERAPRRWLTSRAWVRRLGLGVGYILLALLPVLAFALVTGLLLVSGIVDTAAARLIVIGAGNAYLFCRLAAEALRFVMAPRHADLRLIRTSDARMRAIMGGVMLLLVTAAVSFVVLSAAEILGLPRAGGEVLGRIAALILHIELALLVWRSRHVVAGWIRGNPDDARRGYNIRPRLAAIWHVVALFYILALWVAYAGGVQDAFTVLLRIVGVFLGSLVAAQLLWFAVSYGLDHFFEDSEARPLPALRSRARRYHPLLKFILRAGLMALVVVAVLQGWGVPVVPWLLANPISQALISTLTTVVVTVAVALTLWEVTNSTINARLERLSATGRMNQAARLRTLLPMLKASIGFAIILSAALIGLSKIGVNAAPLLAVSGVLGIAIGFGSQKLVQDIITGLFLLLEDAIQVGDYVTLAGMSGTVERLSIRTIRLRGSDGSVNIIPFSAVTAVTNQTRDFSYAQISIHVGYREDLAHVYEVMKDIAKSMRAEAKWGAMMRDDLQLFGLDAFGTSALVITGQIRTGPGQHWAVRREYNSRVKQRFEAEHIEMPFTDMMYYADPRNRADGTIKQAGAEL